MRAVLAGRLLATTLVAAALFSAARVAADPVSAAAPKPMPAGAGLAAPDPTFELQAGPADFGSYFPSYLANGYFSSMTAPRGTEGNLAYMVAFMDHTPDDIARPAAIPGWTEIDGASWTTRPGSGGCATK